MQWNPDRTKAPYNKKVKEGSCGTKMKKHQQGGSLNGIPFIRTAQ